MNAETQRSPFGRFDRRLRAALTATFLVLAVAFVALGMWLERPWPTSSPRVAVLRPAEPPSPKMEVSR